MESSGIYSQVNVQGLLPMHVKRRELRPPSPLKAPVQKSKNVLISYLSDWHQPTKLITDWFKVRSAIACTERGTICEVIIPSYLFFSGGIHDSYVLETTIPMHNFTTTSLTYKRRKN